MNGSLALIEPANKRARVYFMGYSSTNDADRIFIFAHRNVSIRIYKDIRIISIILSEMGKPSTHNPIYRMKDNFKHRFNLKHTLDGIYMTSILEDEYLHRRLPSGDDEVL